MNNSPLGIALLTAASFIWGTAFVAQILGMHHVGPFTFMATRFALGGLVLLPAVFLLRGAGRNKKSDAEKTDSLKQCATAGLLCGLVLFVAASFQQTGVCYTTAGKAGFITTLYIVIVPVLGLLLGKRVPPFLWACIAAATAGAYLLCVRESFSLGKGDALVFVGAFFWAAHILLIDRFVARVPGVALACMQFFVCALLSAVAALYTEPYDFSAILNAWMPILYTGILSCGGAYTFQILGQRSVKPVPAALILSLESVFAAVAGWLILGEQFSGKELTGAVLLFAAIVASQLPRR